MAHILSHLSFHADNKAGTERKFLQACWSEGLLNGAIEETRAGRYILVLMGRADDGAARTYDIDIGGVDIAGRLQLAGPLRRSGGNRHALELDIASVLRNLTRHVKPSPQALQRCLAALHESTMAQAGAALRQRSAPAPVISRTLSRTVSHTLAPWPAGTGTASGTAPDQAEAIDSARTDRIAFQLRLAVENERAACAPALRRQTL